MLTMKLSRGDSFLLICMYASFSLTVASSSDSLFGNMQFIFCILFVFFLRGFFVTLLIKLYSNYQQPEHLLDDLESATKKLGFNRAQKGSYLFRSLLSSNVELAFGSDWPVSIMIQIYFRFRFMLSIFASDLCSLSLSLSH